MNNKEHIVVADEDGYFYCRAVDGILNYKHNQHVCGEGCPCYVSCNDGRFVCKYVEENERLSPFPNIAGLDEKLYRAYLYSANAHKGQLRKGTDIPYFSHIITAMNYALQLTSDVEVLMAVALHDTVEDTYVTIEDLKNEFGERVAMLVADESEDKRHGVSPSETWEIRKKETIEHLKEVSHEGKIIALSDKVANAKSVLCEWQIVGDDIWNKFNQKDKKMQEWYYRSCADALSELDDTNVMKEYKYYIEKLFG